MLSYLDFLRNKEVMIGLQKIVETNSQFLNDLGNIKGRERPLFFKEVFNIEPQNTFKYNRIAKINTREETEEEYNIILEIRQWIDSTYHIPFSQSAYQAIFWKLTIPTLFDRKYNVTIYPQGDKYTILTFGTKNIIEDLLDKQKKEKDFSISSYLDEQKRNRKITKGRITKQLIDDLHSGDLVFFISQNYVYLPCTSRDLFINTRATIYTTCFD